MTPITISIKITKQQVVKAYRFHFKKRLHPIRDIIIASIMIAISIYSIYSSGTDFSTLLLLITGSILLLLMLFMMLIKPQLIYQQNPKYQHDFHFIFLKKVSIQKLKTSKAK